MRGLVVALVLFATSALGWAADPSRAEDLRIRKARELFESYVRLERTFDPTVLDLYSDEAIIRNRRTYPTGQVREIQFPVSEYKELVRRSLPIAKSRGDINTYTQVTYAIEGDGVRIRATRFSELKKYSSPISILVKPSAGAVWQIVEDLSESRP